MQFSVLLFLCLCEVVEVCTMWASLVSHEKKKKTKNHPWRWWAALKLDSVRTFTSFENGIIYFFSILFLMFLSSLVVFFSVHFFTQFQFLKLETCFSLVHFLLSHIVLIVAFLNVWMTLASRWWHFSSIHFLLSCFDKI